MKIITSIFVILAAIVFYSGDVQGYSLLGPAPYLQSSDSPFSGTSFSYFFLEDFEDGLLNTTGVTASAGAPYGGGGSDSVDLDDGVINGYGTAWSFYYPDGPSITFTFDALALGSLPTHVGLVWTDGKSGATTTFEVYDASGAFVDTITGQFADSTVFSTTGEDRFLGANLQLEGGISKITISNSSNGIEIDHLQYGSTVVVPEPISSTLFIIGGATLGFRRLRKNKKIV